MSAKNVKIRNKHWRQVHKWLGVAMAVSVLLFCISGIVLNHRELVSGVDISRSVLPDSYQIRDYNNGVVKGTLRLGSDSVLVYGNTGMWVVDNDFAHASEFNEGLPEGTDHRNVKRVVRTSDGTLWCVAQWQLYRRSEERWQQVPLPGHDERMSDVALTPDSLSVVALSRSAVYTLTPGGIFERRELLPYDGWYPSATLFRTLWLLHSGEAFGLPGRLLVDLVAAVLAVLCITGIVIVVLPRRPSTRRRRPTVLQTNLKWHNRVGVWTIVATLLVCATGVCLRPPLMIPAVLTKVAPLPGTPLANPNPWHDRLRAVRWDSDRGEWLLSTSAGFVRIDSTFSTQPRLIADSVTPHVSPMGITVFEHIAPGKWLVGSFAGMYLWNTTYGSVTDYFTGHPVVERPSGRPISDHLVCGLSHHAPHGGLAVIDYATGTTQLPPMPRVMSTAPMSLWGAALEVHVGRAYKPVLGPLSELYIFLAGSLIIVILISGYIIRVRVRRARNKAVADRP